MCAGGDYFLCFRASAAELWFDLMLFNPALGIGMESPGSLGNGKVAFSAFFLYF